MAHQPSGSKTDLFVKIVLMVFVCLLSFSVGTFVGKQVSDSEHRAASLEQDYKNFRDVASVNSEDTHDSDHKEESAISEEDVASLTEEFVREEKKVEEHQSETPDAHKKSDHNEHGDHEVVKTHSPEEADGYKKFKKEGESSTTAAHPAPAKTTPKPSPSKAEKPSAANVSSAAERVANDMAPTKTIKEKRLPSSVLPSVATSAIGKYTVQVASYATEQEAKTHAENLKWKGYSAFYIPAKIKNQTWYRVSVGLFTSQKNATDYKSELVQKAVVKSAIVQKIVK